MKNILFLTWKDIKHPRKWWAEVVMLEYAKRLVNDWNKVTWFASGFKWWEKEEVIEGIQIIRKYSINTIYFFAWNWYRKFRKENKVDIVIDEAWWIPLLSPLYEKEIPIYFFIHHIPEKEIKDGFIFPINFFMKKFIYWSISLYKSLPSITVSNSTKEELEKKFNFKNVFVVENSLNLEPIEKINFEKKKNEVVFLWRITIMKRVEESIQAFNELFKKDNSYKLNIIWNKQDLKYSYELEKLIKRLNLSKNVNFIEYSKENVEKYLTSAKLMLVTSTKEWFWLVVLEANSFWLPVFAYDVAWLRDSVKNWINWYLIEDWNFKKMWEEIIKLLYDNKCYRNISESSLEYIKNFWWWDEKYKELKKIIKL